MKKQIVYIVTAIIVVVIGAALFSPAYIKMARVTFPKQGLTLLVEMAETDEQRGQGLMFRPFLPANEGMLFVFEREQLQRVWMKNTLIALDVAFLSDDGKVVSIISDLQPCIKEPCETYPSQQKAKYMLEVNASVISKAGIKPGQKFFINRL